MHRLEPRRFFALNILGVLLCLCGCATSPMVLPTVGPPPDTRSRGPEGQLQVFTQTFTFNDGGIEYFPHTEYRIYHPEGTFFKYVRNHTVKSDQRPETVTLPTGNYYLVGRSEGFGIVRVPFVIKGSQVTVITLDGTRLRAAKSAPKGQFVALPNGSIVGWKATTD